MKKNTHLFSSMPSSRLGRRVSLTRGSSVGLGSGFLWLSTLLSGKALAASTPTPSPGPEVPEPEAGAKLEPAAACSTALEAGLYEAPRPAAATSWSTLCLEPSFEPEALLVVLGDSSLAQEALDASSDVSGWPELSGFPGDFSDTHAELSELSELSEHEVSPVLGQAQSGDLNSGGESSGFFWLGLSLVGGAGLGLILANSGDDAEEDLASDDPTQAPTPTTAPATNPAPTSTPAPATNPAPTSTPDSTPTLTPISASTPTPTVTITLPPDPALDPELAPNSPSVSPAPRSGTTLQPSETVLDQTLMENEPFSLILSTVFTHSGENDLDFRAYHMPRGLRLVENNRLVGQVSDDRELGTHTITLTARETGTTEVAHKVFTLDILNVNDKPFLSETSNVFFLLENQRVEFLDINFSDIILDDDLLDEPALLEENITLPEGLRLAPNGRLAGQITNDNFVGTNELLITVNDDGGEEKQVVLTYTLYVLNQNDEPFLTQNAETAAENAAIQIDFRTLVRDDDLADEPELTLVSVLPAGLRFENGQVLGALTDDSLLGVHEIVVRGSDEGAVLPENAFQDLTYTLTVTNVNDAPRPLAPELFTLTILEEAPDAQLDLTTLFLDDDLVEDGDGTKTTAPLVFGAQWIQNDGPPGDALPAFLTLAEDTLHIRASATNDGDVGTYTLGLTAQDDEGLGTEHRFTLVVDDIPEDPILIRRISSWARPAPEESLEIDLSSYFRDEDIGDTLTFSFTEALQPGEEGDFVSASLGAPGSFGTPFLLSITPVDPSTGLGESITVTATDSTGRTREEAFFVYLPQESLGLQALRTDETVGFVVQGAQNYGRFGRAVSGLGDINGDGRSDFIVGAYWEDGPSSMFNVDEGNAYIFYGASEAPPTASDELTADRGFILQGQNSGDWLGRHVAPGGDVNGDGLADFIVGAPGRTGDDGKKGLAYLVYGTTEREGLSFSPGSSDDAPDGAQIEGGMRWDHLGHAVASAGDINGDGLDDLIVGAPYDTAGDQAGKLSSEGFALVVYGMKDGALRDDFTPASLTQGLGFQIQGDVPGDQLGWSVASAGDLNGDGLGDLVVGAPSGDDGGRNAGEAYVIFGKLDPDGTRLGEAMSDSDETGSLIYQVLDTNFLEPTAGFILQGARAGDGLGSQVAAAGDVNGDGLDDLLVGTGPDSTGNTREAYLLFGQRTIEDFGRIVHVSAENNDQTLSLEEAASGEHETVARRVVEVSRLSPESGLVIQAPASPPGSSLDHHLVFASAGDVNGDGLADTLIGLSPANENKDIVSFLSSAGSNTGFDEVYLLYGTQGMFYGSLEAFPAAASPEAAASSPVERHILPIVDLEPQDGLVLETPSAGSSVHGLSVAGAGDVNQDGFDDFLLGLYLYNTDVSSTLQQTGESYLVYGNSLWRVGRPASSSSSETPSDTSDPLSTLIGGPDGDSLTEALDGMGEVFYGGAGDDVILLTDASFLRVDGGSGQDTLALGRDVTLDLAFGPPPAADAMPDSASAGRSFGRVLNIETLTLQEGASVRLDLLALYRLTEQRDNDVQLGEVTREDLTDPGQVLVRILGSSSASVTLVEGLHDAGDPAADPAGLWAAAEETVDGHTLLQLENALVLIEDGVQILSDA